MRTAFSSPSLPYVICDVEGYENQLLRPEHLANARGATFGVEVHDFTKPSLRQDLLDRFEPTHDCELIWPQQRLADEYPFQNTITSILPKAFMTGPMNEFRPQELCWMIMRPRTGNV